MKARRLERIVSYLIKRAIMYKYLQPTGINSKKIGATLNLLDKADREALNAATSRDFQHRIEEYKDVL